MRLLKQLGMARSASGSVNAKWMPIPTGSVVGIGYHTEVGRYWTRYSVMKKVFEANLEGGVVHECSYHPLKRDINVVPCFEIPKMEKEEEEEEEEEEEKKLRKDPAYASYLATSSYIEELLPPIALKLLSKVERANFVRFNKKGAVLHAYQFSWLEGVKLTPILNLSGRANCDVKGNPFLLTFKLTPVYHE